MIQYQTHKFKDKEIYSILHPHLVKWYKDTFAGFSAPQQYGIIPIHNRENTLIFAPTGTGKTLTAFTSIINELVLFSEKNELKDSIYCVYVSPLKALSRDIDVNLKEPLQGMNEIAGKKLGIRVGVRTGDTTQSQRAKMAKTPPHILITTPESLAIILTTSKFRDNLRTTKWVIIDEIHSLASSKRGVHLSLTLERMNRIANFSRIGLSATVSPLKDVAEFLVGNDRDCTIVDAQFIKGMDLKVLSPVENLIKTPHEQMYNRMYELIDKLIQSHKTTLIFTNTRAATERVVHTLKDRFPRNYTEKQGENARSLIGAHHGSLSASHRIRIEDQLKNGELRCIVSSTSLELGIDIGHIDLVILLGSPKSVARALQRIGRSGHKLHEKAKGRIIVMDRDDLVECSVLLKSAIEKKIDTVHIPQNCLDVLAQQIFGMAIEEKQHIDDIFKQIKYSYCYKGLEWDDFFEVIRFLSGEYATLEDRHVYAKIWYDPETGMIGKKGRLARVMYMTNVGTIPSEAYISVKIEDHVVGKIDEGFLERLKRGDVFVLGGDSYEFLYSRGMTARVRTSAGRPPTIPSWVSEMLPLSFELAQDISTFRKHIANCFKFNQSKQEIVAFINSYLYVDKYGANSIYEYFREQHLFSKIPHYKRLVIEHFKEDNKKYIVFQSLMGRRVNDVLSRGLAYAISRVEHRDVEIALNDNGFMLSYNKNLKVMVAFKMLKSAHLREIMRNALSKTEVLKRRFRHCAARSLMILRNYKGREKSVGKQQVSSGFILNAVRQISEDFPILKEARREVLEDLMDIDGAAWVLDKIEKKEIGIVEKYLDFPSPFAFNLVLQGFNDVFKVEDRMEFLRRMHETVIGKISKKEEKPTSFSYEKVWEEAEKKRLKEEEERKAILISELNFLQIPKDISDEIKSWVYGDSDVNRIILKKIEDMDRSVFGKELELFVSSILKQHDKQEILHRQLLKAYQKIRFPGEYFKIMKTLIQGEKQTYPDEFIDWLTQELNGTISYSWEKDIVRFLKKELDFLK